MPKEGFATIHVYRLEKIKEYYKLHKVELRKKGIDSCSALIGFWLEEKLIESS